jgi:peptidyl-prolyl cis-trans isomerase B (cyclophilin B)
VLGKVVRGMDVLDKIVAAGIIPSDRGVLDGSPAKPVKIERVTFG